MKKVFLLFLIVSALAVGQATCRAQAVPRSTNEGLVLDFYNLAFNAHKPAEAAQRYIGPNYIQHNPLVPNGAAPFVQHFSEFFKAHPASALDMIRVISEGDLVVVHSRFTSGPDDRGQAIIDIFRIADAKIVEHWDVIQQIPEHTANGNTMFSGLRQIRPRLAERGLKRAGRTSVWLQLEKLGQGPSTFVTKAHSC